MRHLGYPSHRHQAINKAGDNQTMLVDPFATQQCCDNGVVPTSEWLDAVSVVLPVR